tara:strand:+ start:785 stop:3274 length:2490 start_codon:yes stop_codon:yes gene_type:complete
LAYIGQRPVIGRYIKLDQISSGFNGSNTGFSMTAGSQAVFPGTARNLLLSLGGVIQEPDTDFTISGSTLTFTTPPVANTTFFAVIFGDMQSTGTPSDGTVLPASIASSGNFSFPQLTVTGTSSLGDDVTFTGASANIVFDKSDNALAFADNAKVRFGTGNDLQIFHDGSNSIIFEQGTGNLAIQSTGAEIQLSKGGSFEHMIRAIVDGAVMLYHDNSVKLETTSYGAKWTGILLGADNQQLQLGSSGDLQLYHDGTNSYIDNANTGILRIRGGAGGSGRDIQIQAKNGEFSINAIPDGAVELYFDHSKKLETTSAGATITGNTSTTGAFVSTQTGGGVLSDNLSLVDNKKVKLGTSDDLQLFHDGTDSIITSSTGDLQITDTSDDITITASDDIRIRPQGGENGVIILGDGAVELFFNASKKAETTSSGFDVNGTLTTSVLTTDGTVNFSSTSDNVNFTGANYHALWIPTQNAFRFNDNAKAHFGTGGDLQISHNGSDSLIANTTGVFFVRNTGDLRLQVNDSEGAVHCVANGKVELYHDNSKKLETRSNGVEILQHLSLGDNNELRLGNVGSGGDLRIYHSSSDNDSFIKELGTGRLQIWTSSLHLKNQAGDEINFVTNENGNCELWFDNSKKLETTSAGIAVGGTALIGSTTAQTGRILEVTAPVNNHAAMFKNDQDVFATVEIVNQSNNTGAQYAIFRGTVGSNTKGSISKTSGNGVNYNVTSDYRLKENVVSLTGGITRLKTLSPKRFNWIEDESKTVVDGFLAHEVTAVPEAVTGTKDEVNTKGEPEYQQMDHSKLVPLLTAALQEEISKRESLEARVAALEAA